jgi:type I restriction enzyme, S subunit
VPKPLEQRAIAAVLSDVDALLARLDRLIAKKRELKQATMQWLLTRRIRLPGFVGKWEAQPFGRVLRRLNAKGHQIQTSEYRGTGRYPVVDQSGMLVVGYSDEGDKRLRCPEGGVIVFGDHTCVVKFVNFDFLVGADGTQILKGVPGQSTRFHAYQLEYRGIEPTGYNRHFKLLQEHNLSVPTLSEQNAIVAVLADMDTEIEALTARHDKTRALKQAMMQELLTGRTRLVPATTDA